MSTSAPTRDRLQFLLAGQAKARWNGIDYVEVASVDQTQLRVHFLTTAEVRGTLAASEAVTISGGETIAAVAVLEFDEASAWSADADGRPLLSIAVAAPGDFSTYTLTIRSSALDPYFDAATFSFKAGCPSDLDCAASEGAGAPPAAETVAINYLAKDFSAFKRALSDFSALRYPNWVERSEADVGVVLMEALSALADELSYLQDRVAAEAFLETATQRVSLLRHARLVDYEPTPATAATTLLQLDVADGTKSIEAGLRCSALGADGQRVPFEVGGHLADAPLEAPTSYPVDARWNARGPAGPALLPYWWDESRQQLAAGATRLWLIGAGLGLSPAQELLIDTAGASSADPPVRELVSVKGVAETTDPVFEVELTRLDLAAPTVVAHDLARTHLAGNLVPAVQGSRARETFAVPGEGAAEHDTAPAPVAVRLGANWTPQSAIADYRYTLAANQISWLPLADGDGDTSANVAVAPELALQATVGESPAEAWEWQRWLLDSAAEDSVFTLTPERYAIVGGNAGKAWFDYDGEGTTIRFGDGSCGRIPEPGTIFTVTYLAGGGDVGNVPADTIVQVDQGQPQGAAVLSCTNPFAADGGAEQETDQQIRDHAPQAFRAAPLRAVRPSDYAAAAQTLPWVQQAGTTFRWTGSWLTAFTTADPANADDLTIAELEELSELLNRRRLSGYESYVLAPRYASIDLQITLCAEASAFSALVAAAVLEALQPGTLSDGRSGFFDRSRWSFGAPLQASSLLAVVQGTPGVRGVTSVSYRERGSQPDWAPLPPTLTLAPDRILRVDNDPSRPENGSLRAIVEGGK